MPTLNELQAELQAARARQPEVIEAQIDTLLNQQQASREAELIRQGEQQAARIARHKDQLNSQADQLARRIEETLEPLLREHAALLTQHGQITNQLVNALAMLDAVHPVRLETTRRPGSARSAVAGCSSSRVNMGPGGDYGSLELDAPTGTQNVVINSLNRVLRGD